MQWIKAIEFQTSSTKLFEKICWKQHIQLQIDIVIICNRLTSKGIPPPSRMCIL